MPQTAYRFGDYELDVARYELRRNGRPLKLERIPMELLILLIERDGHVVTRQEIVDRVWGKDVFVDTEHGINTAIRKIRTVLRDDADRPRFIQTVTGKGYRFVPESRNGTGTAEPGPEFKVIAPKTVGSAPPGASRRRTIFAAAVVLIAVAVALLGIELRDRLFTSARQIHSIAVLPLANLSGDSSQDYFADGMTDEIITMLAKNTSLRVVSRTSAMQYKGVHRPLRDIGKELGVDAILEGSLERTGDRVHMTVQLIHAPSDTHVWANSYDRDLNAIYTLPSEISFALAKETKLPNVRAVAQRYISPEAHDAYLRGRFYWFSENYDHALELMQKAVQLQSDYAAAWSGLADVYAASAVTGISPPSEVMPKAEAAARKALELDDSLAEAHHTLGALYLFNRWDLKAADQETLRAAELNPNLAEVHHLRAYIMTVMNRPEDAIKEQKLSTDLDPFQRPWALGWVLAMQGRFDEAIAELRMRDEAMPQNAAIHGALADAYLRKGMEKEWANEFEQSVLLAGDKEFAAQFRRAFNRGGLKAVAEWRLSRRQDPRVSKIYASPLWFATWTARAGRKNDALKYLEASYEDRSPWLVFLQHEPDFDFLHSEPRYRAIVQKMGLPPAY